MEQQTENLSGQPSLPARPTLPETARKPFKKFWPMMIAAAMVGLLILGIFKAWGSGKNIAQSKLVIANAQELEKALGFFYGDQDRFPTAQEFSDRNLMIQYSSLFPPEDFISKNCSQSFVYKRIAKNSYTLSFCLPKSAGGFRQGWNQVTGSK